MNYETSTTILGCQIDKEHPLWERFVKEIEKISDIMKNGTCNWEYIGWDDGPYSNGYNMAAGIKAFNKDVIEITLEQFFDIQFEIY